MYDTKNKERKIAEAAADADCSLMVKCREILYEEGIDIEELIDALETTLYEEREFIEEKSNSFEDAVQELIEWHFEQ